MKRFFLIFLTFTFFATGCSKKEGGEQTYSVPATSETKRDGTNVIRTQVLEEGKKAVVITYNFNSNIQYNHQEWKIIFSTGSGASATGSLAKAYYLLRKPNVTVTYSANIVNITYPLGEGLGDATLQTINDITTAQTFVAAMEVMDILGVLNLF
jgi:hypothetical protein